MAVITLPSGIQLGPECGMGQARYDLLASSDATGADQVRLLGPPRWTLKLVQPAQLSLDAGAGFGLWASLMLQLRGRVNHLAAWDPVLSAPRGTLRGTLVTSGPLQAGDISAALVGGTPGGILSPGDKLQIGTGLGTSQLVAACSSAVANGSGAITFAFEPPLRKAYPSGTSVTWDKPLAYFKLQNPSWSYAYGNRGVTASGFAGDFLESFG